LTDGDSGSVKVTTEKEFGPQQSVFFNRGAIASQEYARRFQNKSPAVVGAPAFIWLSRGLFEAFQTFVSQANGSSYGLYGAIYEFQWPDALKAIKDAASTGADPGFHRPRREEQGRHHEGQDLRPVQAAHHREDHAQQVLRTDQEQQARLGLDRLHQLTENGIFGHSNCGHVVDDPDVAALYLDYWNELKGNPDSKTERAWVDTNNVAPPSPWNADVTPIFSPHTGLKALEWYASIANTGHKPLFMTFAFGMHKDFQQVYEQKDGILRFALMEKEGNGRGLAQGKKDIRRIRSRPNVVVAVGNNIVTNSFDRWLWERQKLAADANVKWIHTKYMLVDPLGADPVVVTGSPNFSEASTNANNENMLVIRNDQRVVDIYLGEFMRLYTHYAFREAVKIALENHEVWTPRTL
jgi:hypothetical protein